MITPPPDEYEPLTPGERVQYGLLVVIIFGLFAAEVIRDYQPVKLSALLIVAFWPLLLVLHEAGHALMALLLGWRVRRFVIGMGRVVGRFRIGATRVEVRVAPVEGFVVPVPTNLVMPRLKNALVYFAGPGIEIVLVLILVALLGAEKLLTRTEDLSVIAMQSLALSAAIGIIVNLIPHGITTPQGFIANDGLGILRSFSLPDEHFEERMIADAAEEEIDDEYQSEE